MPLSAPASGMPAAGRAERFQRRSIYGRAAARRYVPVVGRVCCRALAARDLTVTARWRFVARSAQEKGRNSRSGRRHGGCSAMGRFRRRFWAGQRTPGPQRSPRWLHAATVCESCPKTLHSDARLSVQTAAQPRPQANGRPVRSPITRSNRRSQIARQRIYCNHFGC